MIKSAVGAFLLIPELNQLLHAFFPSPDWLLCIWVRAFFFFWVLLEQSVLLHLAEHPPQISSLNGWYYPHLLLLQATVGKLLIAAYAKSGVSLSFNLKCCAFGCGERQLHYEGRICTLFGGGHSSACLNSQLAPCEQSQSHAATPGVKWSIESHWGWVLCWCDTTASSWIWAPV